MDLPALQQLLAAVADGEVSVAEATERLERLPYADLGFARVDHHRELRQGMPEAIYGPGKTPDQCAAIAIELLAHGAGPVLLTRSTEEQRETILRYIRDGLPLYRGGLIDREELLPFVGERTAREKKTRAKPSNLL